MTGTQLPQVLVAVKDPDTIIHGAHEFRRVENARRVRHERGMDTCAACGTAVPLNWHYCPECGRRLQNPEEGEVDA